MLIWASLSDCAWFNCYFNVYYICFKNHLNMLDNLGLELNGPIGDGGAIVVKTLTLLVIQLGQLNALLQLVLELLALVEQTMIVSGHFGQFVAG